MLRAISVLIGAILVSLFRSSRESADDDDDDGGSAARSRTTLWVILGLAAGGVFLVGTVVVAFVAFVFLASRGDKGDRPPPGPGESGLAAAERHIASDTDGIAHGNTPDAERLANEFAVLMEQLDQKAFTQTDAKFKLSGGHYVTWCELREGQCVFVVHVPEYRRFAADAKKTLEDLAWTTAELVAAQELEPGDRLAVGLRGVVLYGAVLEGKIGSDGETEPGFRRSEERARLLAYFADAAPAVSRAPEPDRSPHDAAPDPILPATPTDQSMATVDTPVADPAALLATDSGLDPVLADIEQISTDPPGPEVVAEQPQIAQVPAAAVATVAADAASVAPVTPLPGTPDGKPGEVLRIGDLSWNVQSLAYSPRGDMLAIGKLDRTVILHDLLKNQRLDTRNNLELLQQVTACTFTPSGSHLLTGGYKGTILIFDVSSGGRLKDAGQYAGHSKEIGCIATSNDGKYAISGGRDGTLHYWKIDGGEPVAMFPGFRGTIKACQFGRTGRTAMATDGGSLVEFDLGKREVVRQLAMSRYGASANGAAFSADGNLAATCDGHSVRCWNLRDFNEMPKLEDNETQWSVSFTPDGARLLSGGRGKVNVWDVRRRVKVYSFDLGSIFYVQSLAASPDGKYVAAAGSAAAQDVQIFQLPAGRR